MMKIINKIDFSEIQLREDSANTVESVQAL